MPHHSIKTQQIEVDLGSAWFEGYLLSIWHILVVIMSKSHETCDKINAYDRHRACLSNLGCRTTDDASFDDALSSLAIQQCLPRRQRFTM